MGRDGHIRSTMDFTKGYGLRLSQRVILVIRLELRQRKGLVVAKLSLSAVKAKFKP